MAHMLEIGFLTLLLKRLSEPEEYSGPMRIAKVPASLPKSTHRIPGIECPVKEKHIAYNIGRQTAKIMARLRTRNLYPTKSHN